MSFMKLIDKPIQVSELKGITIKMFGGLVKAVVDIEKKIMVIDASMHADEEAFLLKSGSSQDDLWGINLYPDQNGENFIEFDSMINVRPHQKNFSRSVENVETQKQITSVVNTLILK